MQSVAWVASNCAINDKPRDAFVSHPRSYSMVTFDVFRHGFLLLCCSKFVFNIFCFKNDVAMTYWFGEFFDECLYISVALNGFQAVVEGFPGLVFA